MSNTLQNQIENYKQYLTSLSKSINTINTYISDINCYFKIYNSISRSNILSYKQQLSSEYSSVSINRKLSSLKSFNEFLLSINQIDSICILKQDFIKLQAKGNPTEITDAQVEKFLNRVNTKDHHYKSRNIAIINLIANTGIRREEICNLKLKNLDLINGEITFIGKGNKERTVLLNVSIISILETYLADRINYTHADSCYLFVSERANKLHKDSINTIFEYYWTPKCKIKPHQLRHNYATCSIEQDILTLPELQNQLGHSSLQTTGIYAQARKSNIRKKINNLKIG
jgi:site-specific recombinase XerD